MANSPLKSSTGPVTVTVKCNGKALASTYELVSVEVENRVNRIPTATIVFNDGDMPNADFPISNEATLEPGAAITIEAGYDNKTATIFTGVIIKHAVRIGSNNAARLVIECRDKALAMTVARKSVSHVNKKDSDIISSLVGSYGLEADVTATTTVHKELVQYHCTDWDFMVARAEANGLLVTVDGGKVTVKAPDVSGSPVLQVTYGIDMMDFHAEMDARTQYSSVKTMSWDPKAQNILTQTAQPATLTGQGNITGKKLATVLNVNDVTLQSDAALPSDFLTNWAKAQQLKAELARVRGYASFQGSSAVKVGTLVELKGVGQRFTGNVWVSGLTHTLIDGNWVTRVDFGMSPTWFAEQHELATPMAAGLTAGIGGLHIGIVHKLDADPEGAARVQVKLPLFSTTGQLVWARLAKFYASDGIGAFFIPEVGDEVILGFIDDDPTNPVILGSLYSSKRKPPYTPEKKNNTKALVTRSEMKLIFDEEKKKITLVTPAKNTIVIDDDGSSILIEDQTKNKIELNTGGITMDSPKDIKISAKGKITISAIGNVEIDSRVDIKETAANITHTAKIGFTAKGNGSAEVSASGTTTIKGAMVIIN